MLNTMGSITGLLNDPLALIKAANTSASITSNSDQMPPKNQASGSFVMQLMANKTKDLSSGSGEHNSSLIVVDMVQAMFGTCSNLVSAGEKTAPTTATDRGDPKLLEPQVDTEASTEAPRPAKEVAPAEFYECASNDPECEGEFPDVRYGMKLDEDEIQVEQNRISRMETAEIAGKTFEAMSLAGDALAPLSNKGNDANGNVTVIQSANVAMAVSMTNLTEVSDGPRQISCGGGSGEVNGLTVEMPAFGDVLGAGQNPTAISTQLLTSNANPFAGASDQRQTQGKIVTLVLKDENGNPLAINNTKQPFRIRIPAPEPAETFNSSVSLVGFTYFKVRASHARTISIHQEALFKQKKLQQK